MQQSFLNAGSHVKLLTGMDDRAHTAGDPFADALCVRMLAL